MLKLVRGDDDTPDGVISSYYSSIKLLFSFRRRRITVRAQACLKSHEVICDEENTDSTNRHQLLDLAALQGWLEHNLIRFSVPISC